MNKLIAKARTATTDQLFEMAIFLNDAVAKEGIMARAAVTAALEERISPEEFDTFFAELDAA